MRSSAHCLFWGNRKKPVSRSRPAANKMDCFLNIITGQKITKSPQTGLWYSQTLKSEYRLGTTEAKYIYYTQLMHIDYNL